MGSGIRPSGSAWAEARFGASPGFRAHQVYLLCVLVFRKNERLRADNVCFRLPEPRYPIPRNTERQVIPRRAAKSSGPGEGRSPQSICAPTPPLQSLEHLPSVWTTFRRLHNKYGVAPVPTDSRLPVCNNETSKPLFCGHSRNLWVGPRRLLSLPS